MPWPWCADWATGSCWSRWLDAADGWPLSTRFQRRPCSTEPRLWRNGWSWFSAETCPSIGCFHPPEGSNWLNFGVSTDCSGHLERAQTAGVAAATSSNSIDPHTIVRCRAIWQDFSWFFLFSFRVPPRLLLLRLIGRHLLGRNREKRAPRWRPSNHW